jgi:outer membrane protein assembly factor BamD (BamD/ComL family)
MPRTALAAILLLAGSAAAQVNEYRLDDSGKWAVQSTRPLDPDAKVIAEARQAMADNKPGTAKSILGDWIDAHLTSDNPLLAEAYMLRGDARVADGNEFKALYDYEAVIKQFPASEEYRKAVERELEIGIKYLYGLKRIWLGLRWSDATDYGEELLIRVQERLPGSDLAERACIELADYYFRTRDLKQAADAYDIFLKTFPKSRYADKARERRIYANIARFKGPQYDATGLVEARVLIKEYAQDDPIAAQRAGMSDALVARLDESAAAQILEKARWYLKRDDLVSARATLRRVITKHPQTVAAKTAMQMLADHGWEAMPAKSDSPPAPADATGSDKPAPDKPAPDKPDRPTNP